MQFVDHAHITVESGAGGDGVVAWRREKYVDMGGPAGGDGGRGGSVYLEATEDLNTLVDFKFKFNFKAQDGERGAKKDMHGKAGKDCIIRVPCGTLIRDKATGNVIGDLMKNGERLLVAKGGRGGRGNARFATSTRQAPKFAEPGEPVIIRELELELKLLADVGLVGMPNAGKSTLISVVSAAKPKIADYPFTTLVPNLGVVRRPTGGGVVFADIPGLIEGASEGVGLGHEFLRHVERNRLLLHLVDVTNPDPDLTPMEAYDMINRELQHYSERLAKKPQIVVLTKTDAVDDPDELDALEQALREKTDAPIFRISSVAHQGIDPLLHHIFAMLDELPADTGPVEPIVPDAAAVDHDDSAFEVVIEGNIACVIGGRLERLVRVTDLSSQGALHRLVNIFRASGVIEALEQAGVQPGQTVMVGNFEFEYYPDDPEIEP